MQGVECMTDILIFAVLALILGLAGWYVIRARKSGRKCIGCPDGGTCPHKKTGGCTCGRDA